MRDSVYLAGPIANCTEDEMTMWRTYCKSNLHKAYTVDPMDRHYMGDEAILKFMEVVDLDKKDIRDCDFVLANVWKQSTGTIMEIVYAWEQGKIVVVVVPDVKKVNPWIRYHSTVCVQEVSEACKWINNVMDRKKP